MRTGTGENAGTLRLLTANGYFAQFSIGGKKRKGTLLRTCTTKDEAKRRQVAIAKLVAGLRESGHVAVIPTTIKEAGRADDEEFRKFTKPGLGASSQTASVGTPGRPLGVVRRLPRGESAVPEGLVEATKPLS